MTEDDVRRIVREEMELTRQLRFWLTPKAEERIRETLHENAGNGEIKAIPDVFAAVDRIQREAARKRRAYLDDLFSPEVGLAGHGTGVLTDDAQRRERQRFKAALLIQKIAKRHSHHPTCARTPDPSQTCDCGWADLVSEVADLLDCSVFDA